MKRGILVCSMAFILISSVFAPFSAFADNQADNTGKYLNIATVESKPISLDRFVYAGFRDMEYHTEFTAMTMQAAYDMANSGERDGVVSAFPDMLASYPDLRRVPVPIDRTNLYVFARADSDLKVSDWSGLSGLKVGVLSNRLYILQMLPDGVATVTKETNKQVLDGLASGEYDVAVLSERVHEVISKRDDVKRVELIDSLTEYLYLNKQHEDLIPDITDSFRQIIADGRGEEILDDVAPDEKNQLKTVLHIVSSNMEVQREDQFYARLKDHFKGDDAIEWYSIALNARRFAAYQNRLAGVAQTLRQDCVPKNVAAIVVSGEEALQFLSDYYLLLFRNTPVIFYGIDMDYTTEIKEFSENFTGIIETPSTGDIQSLAFRLFPDTKNIYVVNDYTPQGKSYRMAAEEQFKQLEDGGVSIEYNANTSRDVMMAKIRELPENSLVITGSYFRDANGQYYSQNEMKRAFEVNCKVPVFAMYSMDPGLNAIGGKVPDYEVYADTVAGMLSSLLSGGSVADIPLVTDSSEYNCWVFDKNVMDKWNIKEGSLPGGARIVNKIPSIWDSDPKFALVLVALVVLGITAIIGVNVFVIKYRRQREDLRTAEQLLAKDTKIREIKERLERIINTAPVAFMMSVDGVMVETNDYAKRMIGIKADSRAEDFYYDVDKRRRLIEQTDTQGQLEPDIVTYKTSDGGARRFLASFSKVGYEGHGAYIAWAMDVEENEKYKDELKQSRHEIREIKERLENIISASPISYLLCIDGVVVEVNESMKKDTGLVVGDYIRNAYYSPDERDMYVERIKRCEDIHNEILKYKFADGTVHRCILNTVSTDYDGQKAAAVWLLDIERSESQKDQLKAAQMNLQAILDTMPVPVSIADVETMKVVYGNEAYLTLLEYGSLEELQGIYISDALAPVQYDGAKASDLAELIVSSTEPLISEIQSLTSKTGRLIDLRLIARPIDYRGRKSVIGLMTDLSKEKELETSRSNLQTVLDMLPVAIRIVDVENRELIYTNKALLEIFNCESFEDIAGRSDLDFIPEAQPNGTKTADLINNINQTGKASAELQCFKLTGEPFYACITSCVIDYKGRTSSLAIIEDLTAEKEYQDMLLSAAEKEREANQLKGRFLVNMSHEIRTPMNAIIGLTEIELRKSPSREAKEIYRKINNSAKNLLQIINDILDLSKIEADKMELFDSEFELEEVISSALLVASPRLDGKNVEFMLNSSLDLPRYVIGDRTRLWQILKNFLDNSAKYTEEGKIVLSVFENHRMSDEERIVVSFIIEDTGIGIGEEQMQKLFMPYEQFYSEAQKRYTGTGLGMAISKQLCEIMGGNMRIESAAGQGTTIFITIPFKRSENSEVESDTLHSTSLRGTNILAVDDDKISLEIMSNLISGSDARCVLAKSGTEAMEIILRHRDMGKQFDVILLDYMMEGLNGLETARQIQTSLSKSPKLLMVTAYQRLLLKDDLEQSGIDDVIEKPFIPSQFINKLRVALGYHDEADGERETVFHRYDGVHVLLCEDYRLNQEVATGMLAQFGITATIAENGKQGVEILESMKGFDLIFMDLQMPVMDGYEATRVIRADHRFDHIPIVSLTADAMTEIVEKCLEIGMNDHVAKPIEFARLNEIFIKWLPESKRAAGEPDGPGKLLPNKGLMRFGGNRELYERALSELADDMPDEWPDFASALQNSEQTAQYVHKLKGAAGNLAVDDLYNCAVRFESSLRGTEPDKDLYLELVGAGIAFKQSVAENARKQDGDKPKAGTPEEFGERLNELYDALQNYDPKASAKAVRAMKEKEWPADEAKLKVLYDFAFQYDFDAAIEAIEELKEYMDES